MEYNVGDRVVTKKKHPCGGEIWEVVRTGADYKLKCETCGRVVMLTAEQFRKSVKRRLTE